ncbi:MAG: hypothetical protein HKL97_00685 [Acidocella sp.]|nr:hypothetical protein [Acidocella sp.]
MIAPARRCGLPAGPRRARRCGIRAQRAGQRGGRGLGRRRNGQTTPVAATVRVRRPAARSAGRSRCNAGLR